MKKIFNSVVLAFMTTLLFIAVTAQHSGAHEGHDVPGSVQAQHGGAVKATKSLYLELSQEENTLKIYPMTHDFKSIPLKEVQIEATVQLPKAKVKNQLKLVEQSGDDAAQSHFRGSFDAKGAHRYTLVVKSRYQGKSESVTFQVEPTN